MKKISVVLLLILSLFLISCGQEEEIVEEKVEKKDFIVKTQTLENLGNVSYINKTWKLSAKGDITINSQAMGEILAINFKEWDNIKENNIVIKLKDSYSRYGIAINKASTWLASIKLEYENTKLRLDKAISDATINLQKTQQDYNITVKNIAEDKKTAKLNLDDANLNDEKSIAKLNQEKLLNELEKAKLDYTNVLNTNKQTIEWFKRQIWVEYSNIKILHTDIIDFSDQLLWATDINRSANDSFEIYLGAKNSSLTYATKNKILELIKTKEKFQINNFNEIWEEEISNYLNEAYEWYKELDRFLSDLEEVMLASVVSNALTQTTLNWYRATINWYQASIQWSSTWITALKNQVISFLNTYKNSEKSLEENIRLLAQNVIIAQKQLETANKSVEIAYDKTEISNQSRLENAEISLTNAKNALQNTIDSRDVSLRTLENSIKNTEIWVFETSQEYSKLTIKSPIDGQISQVLVDIWQEVSMWTPLFKIVNNNKQEVEVWFTAEQVAYIKVGDKLNIIYGDETFTGSILSISQIADNNLNYNCKIIMNEKINLLWNFVDIQVPIINKNVLLPINIVKVGQNNIANIYILENNKPKNIEVTVGKIWNDKIEILSGIENNMEIIISDVKNYDENKHNIIK